MIPRAVIALSLTLMSGPALALDSSHVPLARPVTMPQAAVPAPVANVVGAGALFVSPMPLARPAVPPRVPVKEVSYGRKGSVCGVKSIRGQTLKPIAGEVAGCGIKEPVQVTEISGVRLSSPAVIDCQTAKTFQTWLEKGAIPAVGRLGGGIAELHIAASYACRPRNNQSGAKVSEHGKGHAVDLSGLTLNNGLSISVLKGWNDPVQGQILRAFHKEACGRFGTVLGPESDRYHQDHLHFDTARYRAGSYCR